MVCIRPITFFFKLVDFLEKFEFSIVMGINSIPKRNLYGPDFIFFTALISWKILEIYLSDIYNR